MVDGRLVWVRDRTLRKMYALPVTYTNRDGEKSELGNSCTRKLRCMRIIESKS